MEKVVGIDLGTTNSVVAVMEAGKPTVVVNAEGSRLTPSVVGFTRAGERLVGQLARRQAILNPENTVYSIKRFMGRRHSEVEEERRQVSYQVKAGTNDSVRVAVPVAEKEYTPEEISALVLAKLKEDAERYLGEKVTRAVITVPAHFNDSQRQATKDSGRIAGLEVLRIINEPTAAALAYGLEKKEAQTILVWDLGGGTFDVSVLEVGDDIYEVKSTAGDTHLGGDDYDERIVKYLAEEFQKDQGVDLRKDRQALQRLREAAEKAKQELSTVAETTISLPFVTATHEGPKHLETRLTRAKFEQLTADLTERCIGPFRQALNDAKIPADRLDEVILVGGATRMPVIQQLVKKLTGKEPHRGLNPDEVVAIGAAIQAGVLAGEVKGLVLVDVTPLSLGIETLGGVMTKLVDRNTAIPTRKQQVFTTAADGQTTVEIHVLQGEREFAGDNRTLGRFHLVGIPAAPRGVPQIEVSFDVDANGILNVSAKDLGTAKEQRITITASTTLDKREVEEMVKRAQEHAAEDRGRRELVDLRNEADGLAYQTEKSLKELGDKVGADDRQAVEGAVAGLREAAGKDDPAAIRAAMEQCRQASYKLAEILYRQAQPPPGDAGGKGASPEGEVIDAEFEARDEGGKESPA